MARTRILIIGGTGFIGPWVVRQLLREGHTVALFHRGQTTADLPSEVQHIYGARSDLPSFALEFTRFAPEVVLDMFPYGELDARIVMQTVRHVARRVVGISSMDVYRAYGCFACLE